MTKRQAEEIVKFIINHYDSCNDQTDWFDFCEMVLDAVVHDASKGGYSASLVKEFPQVFTIS